MEEVIQAVILGIIQGLSEFLPISSSGHLEIGKWLLGQKYQGNESLMMTVVLHVATSLSTIVVFRKDIATLLAGLTDKQNPASREFAWKILISMVPAAIVGLTLEDQIDALFQGQILLVGFCLLLTGGLLFWADLPLRHDGPISRRNALLIGIAQAIAILPGISRSGATIGAALLLKVDRAEAARFSFLMVVPLILGKVCKDLLDGSANAHIQTQGLPLVVGFVTAFIVGLLACRWMIAIVRHSRLKYFAYYCLAAGSLAIIAKLFW